MNTVAMKFLQRGGHIIVMHQQAAVGFGHLAAIDQQEVWRSLAGSLVKLQQRAGGIFKRKARCCIRHLNDQA